MSFHLKRNLIIFATLLLVMQITKGQDEPPAESEEDDSSSEETIEDSKGSSKRRRRRSLMEGMSAESAGVVATKSNENDGKPARAIPGLPDPATILKIAEILSTVGEQVLPILISGNSGATEFISNRVSRDMKFLKNFKSEIDVLTESFKNKK